ncbi:MAG: VTT domain-containing protein [Acidimicrobiales bacterium]
MVAAALGLIGPESILQHGGLALLGAIIFAESGLLIGFFLPGDSLLFIAGVTAAGSKGILPPIGVVLAVVIGAAIAGDQVGYSFGRRVGPGLHGRRQSRLFNPNNIVRTESFFDKHGAKAVVLARFVPIVRTFAPIVAGVAKMHYPTFLRFNIVGGVLWGAGVTLLGFIFGDTDVVKNNFEIATLGVVGLSLVPIAIEVLRHRQLGDH